MQSSYKPDVIEKDDLYDNIDSHNPRLDIFENIDITGNDNDIKEKEEKEEKEGKDEQHTGGECDMI